MCCRSEGRRPHRAHAPAPAGAPQAAARLCGQRLLHRRRQGPARDVQGALVQAPRLVGPLARAVAPVQGGHPRPRRDEHPGHTARRRAHCQQAARHAARAALVPEAAELGGPPRGGPVLSGAEAARRRQGHRGAAGDHEEQGNAV